MSYDHSEYPELSVFADFETVGADFGNKSFKLMCLNVTYPDESMIVMTKVISDTNFLLSFIQFPFQF